MKENACKQCKIVFKKRSPCKFCSRACFANFRVKRESRTCKCGEIFEIVPYKGNKLNTGIYCSKACRAKFRPTGLKYNIKEENKGWFKKGAQPHCAGKHLSDAHKEAISNTSKGIRRSPSTEFKKGQTSGSQNINWKGGISSENTKIRNSREYRDWRKSVFQRDNYTCQICLKRGGILNADHIKSFARYPELRLDLNNGRTLCLDCHKQTDTYGGKWKKEKL